MHYLLDFAKDLLHRLALPNYNTRGRTGSHISPTASKVTGQISRTYSTNKKIKKPRELAKCFQLLKKERGKWACKHCVIAPHIPDYFEKCRTLYDF